MPNPIWNEQSVTEGANSVIISADNVSRLIAAGNWNTRVWITDVAPSGFTANFSIPAPADALIYWTRE